MGSSTRGRLTLSPQRPEPSPLALLPLAAAVTAWHGGILPISVSILSLLPFVPVGGRHGRGYRHMDTKHKMAGTVQHGTQQQQQRCVSMVLQMEWNLVIHAFVQGISGFTFVIYKCTFASTIV